MHVREALAPAGAETALGAAIEAEHGELCSPSGPSHRVESAPGLWEIGSLPNDREHFRHPGCRLAKLTRETVAMATVTAKPIATGPPDG